MVIRCPSAERHSRRAFVRRLASVGLGLVAVSLAVCAPIQPPAPTAAPKPTAAPAEAGASPAPATGQASPGPAGAVAAAQSPVAQVSPAAGAPGAAAPAAQVPAARKSGGVLRLIRTSDVAPSEPHLLLGSNAPIALSVWDTPIR